MENEANIFLDGILTPLADVPRERLEALVIHRGTVLRLIQDERNYLRALLLANGNADPQTTDRFVRGW